MHGMELFSIPVSTDGYVGKAFSVSTAGTSLIPGRGQEQNNPITTTTITVVVVVPAVATFVPTVGEGVRLSRLASR